ncbi:MAG: hypothetical protein ACYC26_15405 [Phycisphaerales bacterium]
MSKASCPMARSKVIDTYFIEHRAKVLDVAAFLDRVDRSQPDGAPGSVDDDVRLIAMRDAIALLIDGQGDRARRILDLLSDTTSEPIAKAPGKGAMGAPVAYCGTRLEDKAAHYPPRTLNPGL